MRFLLSILLVACAASLATAQSPTVLWQFQGIENICTLATLPDADGDGVADVVVETYDAGADGDHLYLLSGASEGTAQVLWSIRPESGASNGGGYGDECVAVCDDLSGDGFPDVLLGTAWGNRSVHAVDGQTGTVLWTFDTYQEPDSGWIYCVRPLADRTGDGLPEVVFGAGSDNDRGYLLDGADGAVIWRFIQSGDALGYTLPLPDVNDDGIQDVLFCGWDNEDRVFCVSGAGSGAASLIWSHDNGASNHCATLIDDVDGDGIADVVVGTWQAANQVVCLSGADGHQLWSFHNGSYNYIMRLVTVDDLDGDGLRDVAVGSFGRGLPVVSAADGTAIWTSYAGTLNGGDFWAVDTVGDLDGDGLGEVIGGSFDYQIYLFAGADGDTLWTYDTGNRLYTVRGAADLSGNGAADVLGGTQYLSSGGRTYALEGDDQVTGVPDLPTASGLARLDGGGVALRWQCSEPVPCVVDRVRDDGAKQSARRRALAEAFARGERTTREVLDAIRTEKGQALERLTETPLMPEEAAGGGWAYRFDDPAVGQSYRISAVLADGSERLLLALAPAATETPQPLLQSASVAPNPFNPRAEIRFRLDRAATVSATILDARGRRVAAIAPAPFTAGAGVLRWDGTGLDGRALSAGIYMVHLEAGGESRTLKAALVR
jgi:hypothetical protein